MRRALIVSPHFPPVNAADMQRVRMSLPYFEQFGWQPFVLAVAPESGQVVDHLLAETVPSTVPVERVAALSAPIGRLFGMRSVTVRALPYLYSAGKRIIAKERIDLVYFSTTAFLTMPLGRMWKRRFGAPYVLDFQDPWLSDYYDAHPGSRPPRKYFAAHRLNKALEPWTLAAADGLVSVSPNYVTTLHERYPWMRHAPSETLAFGASPCDFEVLGRHPQPNRYFQRGNGAIRGVYIGRGGDDLATGLEIVFAALRAGLRTRPDAFARVAMHFVGTDYAPAKYARKTVEPVAQRLGVGAHVDEHTGRIPYFEALQLLSEADFLIVVGSDDASYTASKVYPYILARKPLLAVVHEQSTVVDVLRETRAGTVVTFSSAAGDAEKAEAARQLCHAWAALVDGGLRPPETDWSRFERYSAREMTRRQCALFDRVIARAAAARAA